MIQTSPRVGFDIRHHIDLDASGRAACPACIQDGKLKQKNLSVDLSSGAYRCWRGCTARQIRQALGQENSASTAPPIPPPSHTTRSYSQVTAAYARLQQSPEAIAWLHSRGFSDAMIQYYHLGLDDWQNQHPAIAIHMPVPQSDRYYRKLRISPWLDHDLPKWSQFGVPNTLFFTHQSDHAIATWFCEGEWDAMRLG